jgi:hypothetical protein
VSVWVHRLPSEHAEPFFFTGSVHVPVALSQVPTAWHWSLALHTTASPPVQAPPWHESVCVQALPSLQLLPLLLAGLLQIPVAGLQLPASWHWSLAVHTTGLVPSQAPAWQLEA